MNELRTTLDMVKETHTTLKCKQNDNRTLMLTLLSNGVAWIPEAGSTLELRGKRPDSTVIIQTITDITITNNVVKIELSKGFTKVQGPVKLELNIRKLTEITTFTFTLVIEPSVIQDGKVVSENTSNVLEELNDVLDWGNMYLVKAVNNIVSLTKKHGQYSVGLTSGTRVVLPTVKQGEYVNIDYMFYADSDLGLVFDDNIKWSNRPIIQAGRSYRFSFRYVNGVWYGEWVKLERYIKDYIYKAGDTCDVLTGGYDLERIVNSGSITADFNRDHIGLWVTKDAQINLATISSIDLTNYTKLYLNSYYKAVSDYIGSSKRLSVTIGSTVILPPRPTVIGGGRNTIDVLDVSSITGSHQISFNTPGTTGSIGVDIYEAWLEKDEFVDTTQEIFTKSEKNKLASISASANKVADSTTNGNILIDNVETNIYTHPSGTNPHGTTKSDVGLSNVDNTSDLNKPISTATQTALNGKVDNSQVLTNVPLNAKFTDTTYGVVTTSVNGLMSAIDKTKLNTIEANAEVNNISDVNATDLTDNGDTKLHYHTTDRSRTNHTGTQLSSTISDFASTVRSTVLTGLTTTTNAVISATDTVLSAFGKLQKQITDNLSTLTSHTGNTNNPHSVTKTQVGLSNVDNTTDLNKPISTATQTALNGKIDTSQKGVTNGIAQLNSNGVVPSSQLPSYVDDVLEYSSNALFPATGESGKIYINTTTNITYRWTGSGYAEISPSIALGETSSTAYAGDKGKATTDKVNGHIGNTNNPHGVTKAQVGLSNVPNVTTNNQTPTYTIASSNAALTSGEILSTAFGKIAKAISSLITHLADTVSHITSTERTNWNSASTNNHTHNNKTVLDNTTASYTTAEKTKLSGISTGANKVADSTTNGNILIDNVETNIYTHPSGTNPHGTTKTDVGLGSVDNTADSAKKVLSATKLTNARTLALSGDVSGSVSFDGSNNATIAATVVDDSHNHIIGNVDGLQTALDWVNNNTPNTSNGGSSKTSVVFPSASGVGINFFNSQSWSIYMAYASDTTYGGRLGETTTDYNMYFKMSGENRGFVFKRNDMPIASIDPNGVLRTKGGAEFSGDVICANNRGIRGKRVDGTPLNLIKRNIDDTVIVGATSHSTFIHSYSTPTITLPTGSYRVYHEGNKPLLSDLGGVTPNGTVAYAKELSTVSTSTSVPPRLKKWTRLATLKIKVQYEETNIQFNILNNDASTSIMTAIVSARLKQQTAMGTDPYTGVVVNGVGFNTNNFKAIVTTTSAETTLDLYVAMDEDWRTFIMSKTLGANNLSALTPLQPFIDLPADAKFVPVIFK